jgi:hypothetical protein
MAAPWRWRGETKSGLDYSCHEPNTIILLDYPTFSIERETCKSVDPPKQDGQDHLDQV